MASTPAAAGWELGPAALPDDIALTIASSLEAPDVCALGSCSRFWRDLCASDSIWLALARKRWPNLASMTSDGPPQETSADNQAAPSLVQESGWRDFYVDKHKRMATSASTVIKFVEQCSKNESLEVVYFLKAIGCLWSMEFGFKDIQMFLFTRKHSVLLNLIGLHYLILWLGVDPSDVMDALHSCHISDRQVCVTWFKLGRWFYGFRLPDECRSRKVSLAELTTVEEDEVLGVLNRGAVHEVLRVQITSPANGTSCSHHIMHSA